MGPPQKAPIGLTDGQVSSIEFRLRKFHVFTLHDGEGSLTFEDLAGIVASPSAAKP